jgi:hypothetical protein
MLRRRAGEKTKTIFSHQVHQENHSQKRFLGFKTKKKVLLFLVLLVSRLKAPTSGGGRVKDFDFLSLSPPLR